MVRKHSKKGLIKLCRKAIVFDTTEELLCQIQSGENPSPDLIDLRFATNKVISPSRDSMADELAAIANTTHGVVIFGIDKELKLVNGLPQEKLGIVETWLDAICRDSISPPLFYIIRKIPIQNYKDDGLSIIVRVDIPKSLYVHHSPGGYFQRIGSTKRLMKPDNLARLFQQRSQTRIIRFDEQPVTTAEISCLEKKLWEKFKTLQSPQEDSEFLDKLKLSTRDENGKMCPTVSGILMTCSKPHEYLPNAFIQAVSYRGKERNAAYQIDARDIFGTLDVQIVEACHFVKKNMQVYAKKEPGRIDIPQFDMQAIFEALVNAVAHRDYSIYGSKIRLHMFSDRLEINSPGTLPNSITIKNLPFRQSSRNELLTSLLARSPLPTDLSEQGHRNYLMDKRGEGVPIILSKSQKLSGLRPIYRLVDDMELQLTIFAAEAPQT